MTKNTNKSLHQNDEQIDDYASLYNDFRWHVPEDFNIAAWCCTRWADDPNRIAIYCDDAEHGDSITTYAQLQADANRLSHVLRACGVTRGSRVAIVLPQRPEVAVCHISCHP